MADHRHQAARTALIRVRSTKSCRDRVGRLFHPTGQGLIVALRRARRPVWAPGVRILGGKPIIRRRSRTWSIVDRAPIAWVRWGGREPRRRQPPQPESSGRQVGADHAQRAVDPGHEPALAMGTEGHTGDIRYRSSLPPDVVADTEPTVMTGFNVWFAGARRESRRPAVPVQPSAVENQGGYRRPWYRWLACRVLVALRYSLGLSIRAPSRTPVPSAQ